MNRVLGTILLVTLLLKPRLANSHKPPSQPCASLVEACNKSRVQVLRRSTVYRIEGAYILRPRSSCRGLNKYLEALLRGLGYSRTSSSRILEVFLGLGTHAGTPFFVGHHMMKPPGCQRRSKFAAFIFEL